MHSTIDDMALISQFLEGNDTPLFNRNLIIQTNSDSIQLYARWEGVVACIQRVQYTQTISLRPTSIYYELIREMLIKRHFLPLPSACRLHTGFEAYRRHQIPEGYVMEYTEAKLLWREWRFTWHEKSTTRLRRGILLLSKDNWYPIQDIGFHQGLLVVRTLVSTVTAQPDERLIWLSQTHEPARNRIGNQTQPEKITALTAAIETRESPQHASPQNHRKKDLAAKIAAATQGRPLFLVS